MLSCTIPWYYCTLRVRGTQVAQRALILIAACAVNPGEDLVQQVRFTRADPGASITPGIYMITEYFAYLPRDRIKALGISNHPEKERRKRRKKGRE